MKRKFLEDLGLEKEAVDKIMEEHGVGITAAKKDYDTVVIARDDFKVKLETANATIEGFADYEDTKSAAADYKLKYETSISDHESELANMKFNSMLKDAILKNENADELSIMGNLGTEGIETLKSSKNQESDIEKVLDELKTSKPHLFGIKEPIQVAVGKTGNTKLTDITKEMFGKLSYMDRVELKTSNPEKYDELKGE